jgi:putative ATP-binding cassette transporter
LGNTLSRVPVAAASWRDTAGRFWRLAGGFWRERETRAEALGIATLLALLAGAEVALLLRFNTWNRDLFDALERRDAQAVLREFGVLLMIVAGFCVASAGQLLCRRRLALGWRNWLGARLTMLWVAAGGTATANVDGRIAEDARVSTEEAVELAASLLHSTITLACFIGVLWVLSDHPPITLGGVEFALPGYLLWFAILYALLGMVVALVAGRTLIRTTDERQAKEAEYRAALVRARDAATHGGPDARLLSGLFGQLAGAFDRQSRAFAKLEFFVCAVTRVGFGLPFLVGTPAYLAGAVTLGWVMQAAQAFQTVADALAWPVKHMPRLAQWRASAERVLALADAAQAGVSVQAPVPPGVAAAPGRGQGLAGETA